MLVEAIEVRVGDVVKFRQSNKTHDGYRLENVTGKILTEWKSDFSPFLHFMCENEEDGIFYSSVKPFDSVEIFNRKVSVVQPARRITKNETQTRKLLRKKGEEFPKRLVGDNPKPVLRRKAETVETGTSGNQSKPSTETAKGRGSMAVTPGCRKLVKPGPAGKGATGSASFGRGAEGIQPRRKLLKRSP